MTSATHTLHKGLIRCFRGVLDSWEKWVEKQTIDSSLSSSS